MSHNLFSKSHYVWLESFFRDEVRNRKTPLAKEELNITIHDLADEIESANRGFDKARFLTAIYSPITEEEKKNEIRKQYLNFDPEMTGDGLSNYDFEL